MKFTAFILLGGLFFISCENRTLIDENSDFSQVDGKKQKELANAIRLVENFGRIVNVSTKSSSSFTIKLEEMKTFKYALPITKSTEAVDSVNLYTFILEKEGKTGFAIASGDERVADVYAYVEEGSLSDTICIKGMAKYIRQIPELCAYDLQYCGANETLTKCSPPDYYTNEGFSVRPLISTQWHQNKPYNWGTPGDVCDYYYAGCGVIAMAQIVAYYQKCDRNFDFAALTKYTHIDVSSDSYLTHEVSEFVKYVGSLCNPEYSCSASPGTITYFPACMRAFTRLGYEYEYKGIVDYIDYTKLDNCISKGNVILAFGLDVASRAGHFWVIDGYVPLLTKCDAAKIHCNWGWGGKSDGWYTDYTFRDNYTRPWYSSYHLAYEQRFAYLNVKK